MHQVARLCGARAVQARDGEVSGKKMPATSKATGAGEHPQTQVYCMKQLNVIGDTTKSVPLMSSLELVELINSSRDASAAGLRHADFLAKVPKVLGVELSEKFRSVYQDATKRTLPSYNFPKREACLMAMSYSYELQAVVFDRMTELERKELIPTLPNFSNPAEAARAWAEQYELREAATKALELAAPKVEFVERYVESTGSKGFRQVAKLLEANEARFREFLVEEKIMYRLGGEWTVYQPHIDAGRVEVKTGTDNGHAYTSVRFTPKGVQWIAGLWGQRKLNIALAGAEV